MMAMMRTVTEEGGTATKAALPHFTVAGKTGTAQKVDPETGTYTHSHWLSSFVGIVPASAPRLVIAVIVNKVPPDAIEAIDGVEVGSHATQTEGPFRMTGRLSAKRWLRR